MVKCDGRCVKLCMHTREGIKRERESEDGHCERAEYVWVSEQTNLVAFWGNFVVSLIAGPLSGDSVQR